MLLFTLRLCYCMWYMYIGMQMSQCTYMWRSENSPVELVPSFPFTFRNGSHILRLAIQAHLPLSHLTGPVADSTERFSGKTVCAPWLFVDSTLELEVFSLPLLQCSKQALSEHVAVSPTLRFDQRKDFSIKAGAQLTRESLRGWRKETRAD